MKKNALVKWGTLFAVSALLTFCLAGCKAASTTPPPLAPGAVNAVDQDMAVSLAFAHGVASTLQAQAAAGKVTLTATQKTWVNNFISDLNLADIAYQAYHAALVAGQNPSATTVQNDIAKVTTDTSQVNTLVGGAQ